MTTPRNENLSGKPTLGRYTILREVARSNDIVYEAVDPTINRRLAVKELNIAPTLQGQARRERIERFFREGRAAGAMNHPNIVTIFEIGEDAGRFFIAMEFLEGQSLRDRLHTVGPMPIAEAIATTAALADALAYAHERGVIHRDIKPDNVHILPGGQVKLTDFGIARILGEDSLTMAGQVFGTPSYMSPEQVTGNPLDGRTDQFSLGVLLYEMVTGRKPFTGDTVVTITYRIIHEPMPVPAGVPHEVAQVIERSLSKSAQSRYATMQDFKNALLAASDHSHTGGHAAQVYNVPPGRAATNRSGMPAALAFDPLAPQLPPGMTPAANEPTILYGTRTQVNPMGGQTGGQSGDGTYPPNPTSPSLYPSQTPKNNLGAIAIATIILLAVVGGAGFALRGAFTNMQAGQTRGQLVKITNDGVALFKKKEYEVAAADFKKVRDAGSVADADTRAKAATNETICYRMLGQKAQEAEDLPTAEMWFLKALEVSPLDASAKTELLGVQKRRGTAGAGSAPVAVTPTGEKIDASNPLAKVLIPSPGPSVVGAGNPAPSPVALDTQPGAQKTGDFTAANRAAAAKAQETLNRADAAFQSGRRADAVGLWHDAITAGPGSPAALTAQERLNNFGPPDQ